MSDKKKRLEKLRKMHPDLNVPDEDVKREEGQPTFDEILGLLLKASSPETAFWIDVPVDRESNSYSLPKKARKIHVILPNLTHPISLLGGQKRADGTTIKEPVTLTNPELDRDDFMTMFFFENFSSEKIRVGVYFTFS